jgi:putative transcriptional regulator
VPSRNSPLSKGELAACESKRDLAADLLQSVREMKAGQVRVVSSPVIQAHFSAGRPTIAFRATFPPRRHE